MLSFSDFCWNLTYVPLLLVLSYHRSVVSLLESVASKPAGRSDFQRQREVFPKQIREIKQLNNSHWDMIRPQLYVPSPFAKYRPSRNSHVDWWAYINGKMFYTYNHIIQLNIKFKTVCVFHCFSMYREWKLHQMSEQ